MANTFGTQNQGGGGGTSSQILVPQARQAMEQLKQQAAQEVGISNYAQQYKGDLPSRVNGSVGGQMVKRMIALAESQLSGGAATTGITGTTTVR